MSNVTPFPENEPEPEDILWVCNCGCMSWYVTEPGALECTSCGSHSTPLHGDWVAGVEKNIKAQIRKEDHPAEDFRSHVSGAVDFQRERQRTKILLGDAMKMAVTGHADGSTTVWSEAETKAQLDWVLKVLDGARKEFESRRKSLE